MMFYKVRFLAVFGFILLTGLAVQLADFGIHREVFQSICASVSDRFYKTSDDFDAWTDRCRNEAASFSLYFASRHQLMVRMQQVLDELESSHLFVYEPAEDQLLWHGEGNDTGIRARFIEDKIIIYKVLPRSSAESAGLQHGDEIVSLSDAVPTSLRRVESTAGNYVIRRKEKTFTVFLNLTSIHVDQEPVLTALNARDALLEISSFRAEYFATEPWQQIANDLAKYQHVIVDLRHNSGGNMVSYLRALSPFFCEPTVVGTLSQPRKKAVNGPPLSDQLNDDFQIDTLEKYSNIPLKTYSGYGCFRGKTTVLVDQVTASVSEMFADGIRTRPNTRVWGAPTAGDVLIATWYHISMLGHGYSVSIPEALFVNNEGKTLERTGVWPQKALSYDLKTELDGHDSWIENARLN